MTAVQIALVHLDDSAALLQFESDNQAWFEQHVPPRGDDFYSLQGVREQTQEFLLYHRAGLMFPMLIKTTTGEICGRMNVNVKECTPTVAEIGYRVGHHYTQKGIASSALKQLLRWLRESSSLVEVRAHAVISNLGSRKVLESNGFLPIRQIDAFAKINHIDVDVIEYRRYLFDDGREE
ncbi:GNAT family N-acetyltransferase [Vibrio methylphosphonaticus]|uniref:GNAT family N-acetyltransferase n=1 Tax=Vibrio methylphosphonaticus TaxID=2946866 RepID=UPI002029F5B7|nr:GNAT family N-acetyltransferase [Vibrio methylphosphonaticus]MCL9776109.1 GNAT family N-acetyltransferase [Vibrio methylphosphonaticus]